MSGDLHLSIEPTRLAAELRERRKPVWSGECALEPGDELSHALDELLTTTDLSGRVRRLVVRVSPPIVQLRTLTDLPPVRNRLLDALVRTQAGRFFRRNGAPLVTAATWGPGKRGQRPAQAAAIEEPWLAELSTVAARHGIADVRVSPDAHPALDLRLPAWERTRQTFERRQVRRALLLAALAWLGVLAIDTTRMMRERAALDAGIGALAPGSEAVSRVARQADAIAAMVDTIQAADVRRRQSAREVAALVAALPDGAHLSRLDWSADAGGQLAGAAPSAAAAAAAVEGTGVVDSVRAGGAGARLMTPAGEREGFSISFSRTRHP